MDHERSVEQNKKPKSTTSAEEEPRTMKENATGINIKDKISEENPNTSTSNHLCRRYGATSLIRRNKNSTKD
jgi:hypothetical protein